MSPTASDGELVQKSQGGDAEAFYQLTLRYYRPVAAFILKRVQQPELAEDLAQETFLELYKALKAGRQPRHFSSWLFGIAHNRCGKWLRRKRPVQLTPGQFQDLEAAPSEQELLEEIEEQKNQLVQLHAHLERLPEVTRQMLEWKHRDGKTCDQIAAETSKPVGTIKSQLARAYKCLREALATPLGETRR